MEQRIKYIDIARGFAIIFIVLGHAIVHSEHCGMIFKFFYSFHVMLFFIISGYLFKIKENVTFKVFLKKRFFRIMIPYFIWGIIFLIPYLFLGRTVQVELGTNGNFEIKNILINLIYANGNNSALKQNSALWFLPALFSMEVIYYFIISYIEKINNKKLDIMLIFVIIAIGYLSNYIPIFLPWGINTTLNMGIFFYVGYILRKYNLLDKQSILYKKITLFILLILGIIACVYNKNTVSCIDYYYGNYILMLISGFALSLITIFISSKINQSKILEYIGKNTMGILIFHKLVIVTFQTKLGIISTLQRNSNIFLEILLSIIISILAILISLICTYIVRKILPQSIGENVKI